MTDQNEQFKQAVAAFKAGKKSEARDLLMAIVDQNERHEQASVVSLEKIIEAVSQRAGRNGG